MNKRVITQEKYQNKISDIIGLQEAELLENVNKLNDKLNSKKINQKQYREEKLRLEANKEGIKSAKEIMKKLDDHVFSTGEYSTSVADLFNGRSARINKVFAEIDESPAPHRSGTIKDYDISLSDYVALSRGVGIAGPLVATVGDHATGDAYEEQTNTSEIVEWLMKPLTILDFLPAREVNTLTLRMIQEDTSKNEGGIAGRAEGASFGQIDWGTKVASRSIVSTGAYYKYNEELMLDENRKHFLPYIRSRLPHEFRIQTEEWMYRGAGSNNTPLGFRSETGVSTITNLAHSGASAQKRLESFEDARVKIFTAAYARANLFIVTPAQFSEFLKLKDSDNRYMFAINMVGTPSGRDIPTLWGIPIVESFAAEANKFTAVDTSFIGQYLLGGSTRIREGMVNDDMLKNKRTIVIDAYQNQYTIRPKAVCTWSQATS